MTNARQSGLSGIVFAVTFAVGGMLLGDLFGSFGDSDETFAEYFESSSRQIGSAVGGVLVFISGIALIPFLRGVLRLADPNQESWTCELAIALTSVVAGLVIAAAAAFSTVGMSLTFADIFDENPRPFHGASIAILPQFGFVLVIFAAWALAGVLTIVGWASLGRQSLPRWLVWFTLACAALLLLAPSGTPLLVVPLWALVIAIYMMRRPVLAQTYP